MILVTGASGNVGAEVTRAVLAAGHPVRALSRQSSAAGIPAGAGIVPGDLNDRSSLRSAFAGADAVFLLAGYPDVAGLLADMRAAGAGRVVLLSTGAVAGGDLDNPVVRFNVVSEAAVRDSGLEWTVLRPSGFMSNTLQWIPQLRAGDVVREPFADVPIAMIDPFDIAAVAALALTSDGHNQRSYRLTGPESLLPADRAAILGGVLSRDLHLVAEPDDDARHRMSESMPGTMVDAFFQFFRRGGYDDSHVDDTITHLLGRSRAPSTTGPSPTRKRSDSRTAYGNTSGRGDARERPSRKTRPVKIPAWVGRHTGHRRRRLSASPAAQLAGHPQRLASLRMPATDSSRSAVETRRQPGKRTPWRTEQPDRRGGH